eukprot:GGOE01036590.1.p2 GENE.GGOE01036590.1~~GGOE01036590.1.p2  ORF type:complete len:134 (-),score=33.26 GGOE01036590.1:182-583(-)
MERRPSITLPQYQVLVPGVCPEDEELIRTVAEEHPECTSVMRERVLCERNGRSAEACDILWGAKLAWCIVSHRCPGQAHRLVQCQGFEPDSAATDYTPLHCLHRKWLMDRCLDGKSSWLEADPSPQPRARPPR